MQQRARSYLLMIGFTATGWVCNGEIGPTASGFLVAAAEARFGRPLMPVSYAGVALRTTVRVATPGVGAGGVGGAASGVGVLPGLVPFKLA